LPEATDGGLKDVVALLLDKGADVNAKDGKGKTPLRLAEERGVYKELMEVIRQHGGHD
jgi:ankyrin repeat protein